jgi:hypothetical protein
VRRIGDHLAGGSGADAGGEPEERIPQTMVWVWGEEEQRKGCTRCQLDRMRLAREPMPAHVCGAYEPLGAHLKAENALRRREAVEVGECRECHDAGYTWTYSPRPAERLVESGGQAAAFRDQRGTRWLVRCRSCWRRRTHE